MSTFQQAQTAHQQGNLSEAVFLYKKFIETNPRSAEAHHLLGVALSQTGNHEAGAAAVMQAIQLQPFNPVYYNNLGLIYQRSGLLEQAKQTFQAVLKISSQFADASFNMANVEKQLGNTEAAIKYYKKTLQQQPKHARAAYNLGNTLLEIGKPKSAKEWFERAIKIQPNYAEAHNNLASALDAWNEYDAALQHFEKAVAANPNFVEAVRNLGNAYLKRGFYEKGKRHLADALQKSPATGWEDLILATAAPIIFENPATLDAFLEHLERTLRAYLDKNLTLDFSRLHELNLEPASGLLYQGRPLQTIQRLLGELFDRFLPKIQRPPHRLKHRPRVGFVVTNGHEGVFIKCMRGIINHFDNQRFEVFVVCSQPHGEAILRPAITNPVVQFLAIPKPLDQAMQVIAQANFDVLHYWEVGTDYQNYFLPFLRLAPVQCATWGWPSTTGIPSMDYFVSCELLETPESDQHYTEELVRLKKLPTYYYRPPVPTVLKNKVDFGFNPDVPLYLVAQNLRKIHCDFDVLIKNILEKDPKGQIAFIQDSHQQVTDLLKNRLTQACGRELANRIVFLPRMKETDYLNLVAISDVILDTLYYTGGANTAYDAFAAGTPYVTLPWNEHRGRYGTAAYLQIGITDGIAADATDYVEKAFRIANDAAYRQQLSEAIQRNSHLVFEDIKAVRELESFFSAALI